MTSRPPRSRRGRPRPMSSLGEWRGAGGCERRQFADAAGWVVPAGVPAGPPLFRVRWSGDVLAEPVHRLRENHAHYSDVPVGGVLDRIIWMVPHGRIADAGSILISRPPTTPTCMALV